MNGKYSADWLAVLATKKGARLAPRVVSKGCVRFAQGAEGKVLRIDRPFRAGGFLSLTGPSAPRVADCPLGNAYEVSVTGFIFLCHMA